MAAATVPCDPSAAAFVLTLANGVDLDEIWARGNCGAQFPVCKFSLNWVAGEKTYLDRLVTHRPPLFTVLRSDVFCDKSI